MVYEHVRRSVELATDWMVGRRNDRDLVERLKGVDWGNTLYQMMYGDREKPDLLRDEVTVEECPVQEGLYHITVAFPELKLPDDKMLLHTTGECGCPQSVIIDRPKDFVVMRFTETVPVGLAPDEGSEDGTDES